jgi:hypothetical protein
MTCKLMVFKFLQKEKHLSINHLLLSYRGVIPIIKSIRKARY